jgi:hypothetical protein
MRLDVTLLLSGMKTTMKTFWPLLIGLLTAAAICVGQDGSLPAPRPANIEIAYDKAKDRTTVRLAPVQISGEVGKYRSLHMSPYFSFPGQEPVTPSLVDFELQTVVKGRLRTDLYVVFVIDGETVFLSSNRWAVKRPVPGRVWVGERLVFRMPYETFSKITKAKTFAIKFDGVVFTVGETQQQALSELMTYMKPAGYTGLSHR